MGYEDYEDDEDDYSPCDEEEEDDGPLVIPTNFNGTLSPAHDRRNPLANYARPWTCPCCEQKFEYTGMGYDGTGLEVPMLGREIQHCTFRELVAVNDDFVTDRWCWTPDTFDHVVEEWAAGVESGRVKTRRVDLRAKWRRT